MKLNPNQHRPGLTTQGQLPFQFIPVLVAIALLTAGAWAGMSSVFLWIFKAWWSFAGVGVYSHGYLVLGMSIWMGWAFWLYDPPQRLSPNWWLLIPLLGLMGTLSLMELLYIDSSRVLLVPPIILSVTGLFLGTKAAQRLAIPVLFLYSGLLPFWMLNPVLQAIATEVTGILIRLGNIPAYIEGNFIHVTAGVFEIASACSGLSFFLSAVSLAVFYSAMYLWRWRSRWLLLLAAAGAALVSNWIRIWSLVLIGHYTEMQHWLIGEHYLYGWFLFVIAMAPVLFFAKWLEDRDLAHRATSTTPGNNTPQQGQKAAGQRLTGTSGPITVVGKKIIFAAALGGLLLLTPRFFVAPDVDVLNATEPLPMPPSMGDAQQLTAPTPWSPVFTNAREGRASYQWDGTIIHVYRAVYPKQNRSNHLFLSRNSLLGRDWQPISQSTEVIRPNGKVLDVVEFHGRLDGDEHLVWAWYEVLGQPTTSRWVAKLIEVKEIHQGRNEGVVIALSVACGGDCERSRRHLHEFTQAALPDLQWQQ